MRIALPVWFTLVTIARQFNSSSFAGGIIQCEEDTVRRKDGSVNWVHWELRPWYSSKDVVGGISMFFENITSTKRAELELKRSNAELEQFAFLVSHDLQEPLRVVTSYLQLIEEKYAALLDNDGLTFIGYAVEGTQKMRRLIRGVLEYSQIGKGKAHLESCDAALVLNEVLSDKRLLIEDKGATVTFDALPKVGMGSLRFGLVLQNLLGNALKYNTSSKPLIHISAFQAETQTVFSVRDNGIGIDAKDAERIFLMFQRVHPDATYAGSGIGLASCKKVIEQENGKIWVESTPGEGSTFYFSVPSFN